jgi:hypothetical protein
MIFAFLVAVLTRDLDPIRAMVGDGRPPFKPGRKSAGESESRRPPVRAFPVHVAAPGFNGKIDGPTGISGNSRLTWVEATANERIRAESPWETPADGEWRARAFDIRHEAVGRFFVIWLPISTAVTVHGGLSPSAVGGQAHFSALGVNEKNTR